MTQPAVLNTSLQTCTFSPKPNSHDGDDAVVDDVCDTNQPVEDMMMFTQQETLFLALPDNFVTGRYSHVVDG